MATKIQKWGNSLAVRLPKEVVRSLKLSEGSEVLVREDEKQIVIQQVQQKEKIFYRDSWRQFLIPTRKKKENVSGAVDQILYGTSS